MSQSELQLEVRNIIKENAIKINTEMFSRILEERVTGIHDTCLKT